MSTPINVPKPAETLSALNSTLVEETFEIAYTHVAKRLSKPPELEGEDAWGAIGDDNRAGFRRAIVELAKVLSWPIDPDLENPTQ